MIIKMFRWLLLRFKDLPKQLWLLVRGLRGSDRRENKKLIRRLAALRADYNALKQDMAALYEYADGEIQQLKADNKSLGQAKDELQLKIWDLEEQVDGLLQYIAQLGLSDADKASSQVLESVTHKSNLAETSLDLVNLSLAIIGGHRATRQGVIELLSVKYGLRTWVEIPPLFEAKTRQNILKAKIEHCDLIVIITGYMSHPLTHAVYGLKEAGSLSGKVVLLNCRGRSGVVREVLAEAAKIIKS